MNIFLLIMVYTVSRLLKKRWLLIHLINNDIERKDKMKKCSISSLLSIIVTLISIFICFTTMFTNIYNNTDFNFWYFPGAIIFVISIIINIIAMFKGNKTLNIILFFINFLPYLSLPHHLQSFKCYFQLQNS